MYKKEQDFSFFLLVDILNILKKQLNIYKCFEAIRYYSTNLRRFSFGIQEERRARCFLFAIICVPLDSCYLHDEKISHINYSKILSIANHFFNRQNFEPQCYNMYISFNKNAINLDGSAEFCPSQCKSSSYECTFYTVLKEILSKPVHSIQFLKKYSLNLFMRARPLLPYIKLCTWIKVRIVRFYFININILLNLLINKSHKNKGFFILWNT